MKPMIQNSALYQAPTLEDEVSKHVSNMGPMKTITNGIETVGSNY
jgi:hypothetical protein